MNATVRARDQEGSGVSRERTLTWLLLAPAALPLVISSGIIFPYLVPKTLSFYAVSLLSAAAFLVLFARGKTFYYGRLLSPVAWIPAALLALAYVSSFFGIDFYRSFWSLFIRGDGLLMLTCAVADFYLILLAADRAFFNSLLRSVAAVAIFTAVYGIGEWLFSGGRIGSLFGNPAFFASYLSFALFATLAAARGLPLFWRRVLYVGAALEVIAAVLTATRGTMLALFVALLAALAYAAFVRPSSPVFARGVPSRSAARAALLGIAILLALFVAFRGALAHAPLSPVARAASASLSDPDIANRLFVWRGMVGQIAAHPWLGVGTEHIDVLFNNFYDPAHVSEQWFDRAHNAFLDYAAQYGVLGLALYLALIGAFFFAARRLAKKGETRLALLATLLALTYAVGNFFVFDTISSFWLFLALLAGFLALALDDVPASVLETGAPARTLAWGAAVTLVLLIIPVSLTPLRAAYDLAQAYGYQLADPARAADYLTKGMALGTYGDLEYGYEAYDMYVNHQATALTGTARMTAYQTAETILDRNFRRYPYDARTALYLALVLSQAPSGASVDHGLFSEALATTMRESPKRPEPWYLLVNMAMARANGYPPASSERAAGYAAARDMLKRYIAIEPALSEPHFVLAQLEFAAGDTRAAAQDAQAGKRLYESGRPDAQTARRAAGYYESAKDWGGAAFFLRELTHLDPADFASWYDLAKVSYLSGDPKTALAIVQKLRASDPAILGTDQNFLNAITAYERSNP